MIHTPGIYVDRIIKGVHYEKRIEQRTVRQRPQTDMSGAAAGEEI